MRADLRQLGLGPLTPVIIYLREPKEKCWGVLVSFEPGGVVVRGLDLAVFEDWMRQEARSDDALITPTTIFYPMHRVERVERDEGLGPIEGFAARFEREVGRSVLEAAGFVDGD